MNRRTATAIVFIGFFLLGIVFVLWGILLPDLSQQLEMSEMISGVFFALISLGAIMGGIVGGKYAQRFDFLLLFATLIMLVAILLVVISFIQHWIYLLVGALFLGLFSSTLFTIGHTVIARLHPDNRPAMMGYMDVMFSLGALATPFYVSALYIFELDWRWTIRTLTLGLILLAVCTWQIALKHKLTHSQQNNSKNKTSLSYSDIMRKPIFILLALGAFGYGMVEFGNGNWFVSYVQNAQNFNGEQARLSFAFFTGGMVISRLIFAYFLRWFSVHTLMVILASTMIFGCFVVKLAHNPTMISWGNGMLGLGLGGLFPLMLSAAMDVDSDKGPLISGICVIGSSLGVQTVSLGTGLWAYIENIDTAFWMIPLGGTWLWVVVWFYSRSVKRHNM